MFSNSHNFDDRTAREVLREVSNLRRKVDRMQSVLNRTAGGNNSMKVGVEFVQAIAATTSTNLALAPGGSGKGYAMKWNRSSSIWEADTARAIKIYDDHGWAAAVPGETVPVYQHPLNGRFTVSAPFGLFRMAKADGAITAGNSGTVSVYEGPTIDSGCNVTAKNDWTLPDVDVATNDELWILYNVGDGAWYMTGGGDC